MDKIFSTLKLELDVGGSGSRGNFFNLFRTVNKMSEIGNLTFVHIL